MTGHAPLCVILTPYSSSREREIRSECGGVCFSRDRTHTDTVRVSCQEVYLEAVVSAKPNVHVVGRISTSDLVPDGAVEHDNRHAGAGRRLLDIAEAHSGQDVAGRRRAEHADAAVVAQTPAQQGQTQGFEQDVGSPLRLRHGKSSFHRLGPRSSSRSKVFRAQFRRILSGFYPSINSVICFCRKRIGIEMSSIRI
ncbi:Hypothetical predicted protein [Cloeon dipterum]|uniref:Uncharacterized protein n=2 Tax=Cloeon dipterum TaxID=197152 RepID=A0A8S1CFK4_9INSE|nr:Hypothetical predicted protein [Cloeon dipterum]